MSTLKEKIGCAVSIVVGIVLLISVFMFGSYVGGEVLTAVGATVDSSVVNFIVGCLSLSLIASIVIVILTMVAMVVVGLFAAFFN